MKLKGFKKSDGTIAKIYTDPTLTESDSPADAASVKAKDDLLQQGITNNSNYAAGLNTRLSELENGAPSIIAPKVTEWLDANVDPTGSAVTVDSSLTIAGSAADAKKTGDEISHLKSDLNSAFDASNNLFDEDAVETGLLVYTTGNVSSGYTSHTTSGFIPVTDDEAISAQFDCNGVRYDSANTDFFLFQVVCFYDASRVFVSGVTNQKEISVPSGAKYMRFSVTNATLSDKENIAIVVNANGEVLPYNEYGGIVSLKESMIPSSYDEKIKQLVDTTCEEETGEVNERLDNLFVPSPNIYDNSINVVGLLVASNGNLYPNFTNFISSDFIKVFPNGTIRAQFNQGITRYDSGESNLFTFYTVCFYDANKTFVSGVNSVRTVTVPSDVAYLRFSIPIASYNTNTDLAIIESESSEIFPYVAPNGDWYLKQQYIPSSYDEHIKEIAGISADDIILTVPQKVFAVVGIEYNIYFENITEDWHKYKWDVTCSKGMQAERGFVITPYASDVGEYSITIRASIDENTYKEVSSTLVISATNRADGVSIIVLGDSTTANGVAVSKIHDDFESMNTTIETLGTRGTAPNTHEGRSGWRLQDYITVQSRDGVDNPFYNPSTNTFDASYYFSNSGVSVPDWFFINLGINDVFGYASDSVFYSWLPTIMGYCNTIIQSLQSAEPNIKIGVCITIPPNDSQDAFGKAYGCAQTRDRCKRNNVLWQKALIDEYASNENVYLVPIHTNLDTVYNMGMETLPVNARNTAITYQSPIGNGGVHPVESGYWQIADVYTAFLKAQT